MHLKKLVKVSMALGVTAVALLAPSTASAANPVPNPGFEADCGGIPCSWNPLGGTLARDTASPHSGSASLKLTIATTSPNQANTQSVCVNGAVAAGTRGVGYWYRANAGVSGVAMIVNFWNQAGCGAGALGALMLQPGSVNTSNTWTLVNGNMTIPAGVQSIKVTLSAGCTSCGGTPRTVNFDDVSLEGVPTAATLVSFRASHTAKGVRLTWKTAAAPQIAGFHVYRGTHKLNRTLITGARTALGSGTYAWLDRSAPAGKQTTYRLQAVYLDGTRAWLGSTRV